MYFSMRPTLEHVQVDTAIKNEREKQLHLYTYGGEITNPTSERDGKRHPEGEKKSPNHSLT